MEDFFRGNLKEIKLNLLIKAKVTSKQRLQLHIFFYKKLTQGRGHFNLRTKQDPTVSVSNIRNTIFYDCSEIIRTRNFTMFTVHATIFGQFTIAFHFSNYIGETDHFTLDLLKRFGTSRWTF